MHYFKFNIPTWALHTAHLTPEEEGIYLRLVTFYYDTEEPIPQETQSVLRRLRLGSHGSEVGLILSEFFELKDGGWHHKRCDEVLKEYHQKAERNRLNGKRGGRPSKKNPKETHSVNSGNPNKTLTINHKPLTINHKSKGFTPPTVELVASYVTEKGYTIDPHHFVDYYQAQGWKLSNGRPMADWKAAIRTWAKREKTNGHTRNPAGQHKNPGRRTKADEVREARERARARHSPGESDLGDVVATQ